GLLQNGLKSMPAAATTQYRGLRFNTPAETAAFDAQYTVGATVTADSYWSTGPDPGNAYAGGRNLIIHTPPAKHITDLPFGVHFHPPAGKTPYSSEAIIPPGTKFRVTAVDPATGTVTLQQL